MKIETPKTDAAEKSLGELYNEVMGTPSKVHKKHIPSEIARKLETELHEYRQVANHLALAISNLNKGRERCQDCGRDLKDVAGDKPTPPITAGTKLVGISDLLDALRQYWNERIERKRASARNFAAGGEYSIAARLAAEVEATELCLKDLETESASNAGTKPTPTHDAK